ncbi:cardiotrophin-like cytokine factor 1 [Arapaima gigas]
MRQGEVRHLQLALLLAAVVASDQLSDPILTIENERSSIERTYELTKYLEHQLREIKDTYLSYLGPPFSDPDFSPPRPNTTALSLPSAATRLDLWRGLENRARLAQNHRAYSVLLGAVKELAQATLCPYLQSSLIHFSVGLDGLLGSISGLMTTLGYALPPSYYSSQTRGAADPNPDPLTMNYYNSQLGRMPAPISLPWSSRYSQNVPGIGGVETKPVADIEGQMDERDPHSDEMDFDSSQNPKEEEEEEREGRWQAGPAAGDDSDEGPEELTGEEEIEGWGSRRRLLSIPEVGEPEGSQHKKSLKTGSRNKHPHDRYSRAVRLFDASQHTRTQTHVASLREELKNSHSSRVGHLTRKAHQQSLNRNDNTSHLSDVHLQFEGINELSERRRSRKINAVRDGIFFSSTSPAPRHRFPRSMPSSLYTSTVHPPLSPFTLLYQLGSHEDHTLLADLTTVSSLPMLSSLSSAPLLAPPSLNDFSRKVESFWVLRELQSWLWRSAKDFNRLKKRLRV